MRRHYIDWTFRDWGLWWHWRYGWCVFVNGRKLIR